MKLFLLIAALFILDPQKGYAIRPTPKNFAGKGKLINRGLLHPGGMHPKAQPEFVKNYDAYLQLILYVDSAFQHSTHALADFNVPVIMLLLQDTGETLYLCSQMLLMLMHK